MSRTRYKITDQIATHFLTCTTVNWLPILAKPEPKEIIIAHPKFIQGVDMMVQKIEYIHNNPVKRGFVDLPEHWRSSSASNYSQGVGLFGCVC